MALAPDGSSSCSARSRSGGSSSEARCGSASRTSPSCGAATGFLSALVAAIGPVNTPFFLGYGLRRGAYVGTEAACVAVVHLAKTLVYRRYALVGLETGALGLAIGAVMFVGAWLGRRILERMSERAFVLLVEALLVALGILFVLHPLR